ncbi:hypothetical protein ACXYMP_14805 [Aliiroseovarius sp. CAU 1755]
MIRATPQHIDRSLRSLIRDIPWQRRGMFIPPTVGPRRIRNNTRHIITRI